MNYLEISRVYKKMHYFVALRYIRDSHKGGQLQIGRGHAERYFLNRERIPYKGRLPKQGDPLYRE